MSGTALALNPEMIPSALSMQVRAHAGYSPSGVTVTSESLFGQGKELNFGTSTPNFEQLSFIGKKCRQTLMLSYYDFANLILHVVSVR